VITRFERLVFRHFYDGFAVAGALTAWALASWLLAPLGFRWPATVHVAVPTLLALLNRLACRRLEQESASGLLTGRGGQVLLATSFTALVGTGVFAGTAAAWVALHLLVGALNVEAGVVLASAGEPFFGSGFRLFATGALGLTAGAIGWGFLAGYRRLVVTSVRVPVAGLPPALAGLRIAHVTDFHLGPLAERGAVREAIERVVALDADLVCVTGDIIDSPATDVDAWVPELAPLRARHGVFVVLGNHDRVVGAERVVDALRRATSWQVLRDELATFERDGGRLHLLGLEDRPEGTEAEALPALLAQVPAGEPALLLAHRPTVFPAAAAAAIPLTLTGHTHGGQVVIPGLPSINMARVMCTNYVAGWFARGRSLMHVNRGLGTSIQRIRLGVPREITVVELATAT
jgi:predicted MPP superfamily phosphohydrolase